jgi:hypothetical protein
MFDGRSSAGALSRPGTFVGPVRTFGESASDFVSRRPHHLRVVADLEEIVLRRAVRKVVLFQEPRFGGKHPNFQKYFLHINHFDFSIKKNNHIFSALQIYFCQYLILSYYPIFLTQSFVLNICFFKTNSVKTRQ